jgi:hypothetical protein
MQRIAYVETKGKNHMDEEGVCLLYEGQKLLL